ncbi:response regulator transcription factor [Nocardia sp. IFM 10818]
MSEEIAQGNLRCAYISNLNPPNWHEEAERAVMLSSREIEVFHLLGNGRSNRAIAGQLNITERTVKAHVARIMAKLGVESRLQAGLVSYAYQITLQNGNPNQTVECAHRCSCINSQNQPRSNVFRENTSSMPPPTALARGVAAMSLPTTGAQQAS